MKTRALALGLLFLVACDDKKEDAKPAASATASATASAPAPSATPAVTASAAPSATGSAASAQTSTKDPNVSVQDPTKEPAKSVKADVGTSVTLYLPKWAGTTWSVKESPKPLGKAKEETIPGFAGPSTPAAGFVWKLNDPSLKAGQSLKVTLENKDAKDKAAPATKTFTLTIDLV